MISIIVPVYNAGQYLNDAVHSVYSQSFIDWELILIDDGSTDGSGPLCDRMASSSEKIRCFHKKNGGLSSARNAGLDLARGELIFFLDADDILPQDALALLYDVYLREEVEIVCGNVKRFKDRKKVESLPGFNNAGGNVLKEKIKLYSPVEAVEQVLYQKEIDNSACGKLFAASLWKEIRFREGIGYEDIDIFYKLFLSADKIAKIDETVYLYRQHHGSYLHNFSERRCRDVLDVTARLEDYMRQHRPELLPAARSRRLSANFNVLLLLKALNSDVSKYEGLERECLSLIKEYRLEALSDPKVRMKNKLGCIAGYGGDFCLNLLAKIFYR